jgi:sulfide:quinone oxidoreductase
MAEPSHDERPRIVVAGAGVAALEFLLALGELAPGRTAVKVIAPETYFTYRPLAVAQTFGVGDAYHIRLDRVMSHVAARQVNTRVASVDRIARVAFTATGEAIPYDILVVAAGARGEDALPGALTFHGWRDEPAVRALLEELDTGSVSSVAFAAPPGISWALPLYELALLSATQLKQRGRGVRIVVVTPEAAPLEVFGATASDTVAELLDDAGIEIHCRRHTAEVTEGGLRLAPDTVLEVDRVVTLPRLRGPHLAGLASTEDGFVPTDLHGLVRGTSDVYAAGDATAFPVKHGGISVDQGAAVAEAVAARLGAPVKPRPFRPVLRGLLLTGEAPRFLWSDPAGGLGETSAAAAHPLWWPPGKIAGGRLATYLHAEGLPVPPPPAGPATTPAEIDSHSGTRPRNANPVRPPTAIARSTQLRG